MPQYNEPEWRDRNRNSNWRRGRSGRDRDDAWEQRGQRFGQREDWNEDGGRTAGSERMSGTQRSRRGISQSGGYGYGAEDDYESMGGYGAGDYGGGYDEGRSSGRGGQWGYGGGQDWRQQGGGQGFSERRYGRGQYG